MKRGIVVTLLLMVPAVVAGAEKPVKLAEGAGRDVVENNCQACHSLDYIIMNSPFLDREGWGKEVTKMVTAFGAPIGKPEQEAIVAYLAEHYGGVQQAANPIIGR
ncbi:MAG: cytochrome c [Solirubrobacterales bacterium]